MESPCESDTDPPGFIRHVVSYFYIKAKVLSARVRFETLLINN
jgi:hypothetical protein